jgi:hypothetical protein
MSKLEITRYEVKPEWDRIEVKNKWANWTIENFSDGNVEIECWTDDVSNSLLLNQEELKQLIEFLQSKVK